MVSSPVMFSCGFHVSSHAARIKVSMKLIIINLVFFILFPLIRSPFPSLSSPSLLNAMKCSFHDSIINKVAKSTQNGCTATDATVCDLCSFYSQAIICYYPRVSSGAPARQSSRMHAPSSPFFRTTTSRSLSENRTGRRTSPRRACFLYSTRSHVKPRSVGI